MDRFVDPFYVVRKVRSAGAIAASATIKLWWVGLLRSSRLSFLTESLILAQNERWRRG